MVSLALPWSRLDSLESTWSSLGLIWNHIGFPWTHSASLRFTDSLGLTRLHLDVLGFTWIHLTHLDSLGFTWNHLASLDSFGFIWIRLDPLLSPLLSALVQGKREHGLMDKGKGKVPAQAFSPGSDIT